MPTASIVNILLHALAVAPDVIEDVQKAVQMDWHHPVIQDARQGLSVLVKLFDDAVGLQPKYVTTLSRNT